MRGSKHHPGGSLVRRKLVVAAAYFGLAMQLNKVIDNQFICGAGGSFDEHFPNFSSVNAVKCLTDVEYDQNISLGRSLQRG